MKHDMEVKLIREHTEEELESLIDKVESLGYSLKWVQPDRILFDRV